MDYLLVAASMAFLTLVGWVGIPFHLPAGPVTQSERSLHFVTDSGSLAHLVTVAPSLTMECREARFCIRPTDTTRKRAHVPIPLEPCTSADAVAAESCREGKLILHLDTARWIASNLRE